MDVVIIGAGGHARVCLEALVHAGHTVIGSVSDRPPIEGFAVPVLAAVPPDSVVFVAVGDNTARQRLAAGHRLVTAVAAGAYVSPSAIVGDGVLVAPLTVVNPAAHIGQGVIVNTGAVVEHDCVVGDFAHIGPGAVLAGGVTVGELALVGLGARVLPGVHVGASAVVGAGAVVVRDVADHAVVRGVPAR